MKRLLAVLLSLFFMSQVTLAASITIPQKTVNVPIGSNVHFDVEISSNKEDVLNINILDNKPWISLSDTRISINEAESGIVTLSFSPPTDTPVGLYKIRFIAESLKTGDKESRDIYISVVKEGIIEIEKIFVTGDMEPAGRLGISVQSRSFMTITAQDIDLSVIVRSPEEAIFSFIDIIERIDPDKTTISEKYFYLPDFAEPGIYTVDAELKHDGKVSRMEQNFVVAEKPVIKTETEEFLVLGTGKVIAVTNVGNKKSGSVLINENISDIEKIFFSGDPDSISGNVITWEVLGLQPGESKSITYKIDYVPVAIAIVILMFLTWYFVFSIRTLNIRKRILQKKMINEGSEFTVGVELKNRTGSDIKDVIIRDFIPSAFKVIYTPGPKPTKRETSMGTELKWKIENLTKGEERILTYRIMPVFGVYGQVKLSGATMRFRKKGIMSEVSSNPASMGIAHKEKKGK